MIEEVLPPTRNVGTAVASLAAALLVIALAVALVADPIVTDVERLVVALLGALFAGTLIAVGVVLLRGHGALLLDSAQGRLGLGVTRQGDTWWLALRDVAGLAVRPLAQPGKDTIERWMLVLGLRDRPEVVLAESDDRGAIMGIGERLAARLTISDLSAPGAPAASDTTGPPRASAHHQERFAVSRGAALQGLLAIFGTSLVAVGVIAFTEVQREPVVGFIFAPILVVMGAVLLAVPLVKRFARETLAFDGAAWTHGWELMRWRWGHRTVRATEPRFRLRLLGMRGGMLELIGDDGVLVIAAGATAHSRLDLEGVAAIPSRFSRSSPS